DFGDAAHGPCRHDSIYVVILNGNGLRRAFNEPQWDWSFSSRLACHFQELRRRVEADDLRRCAGIERQVEAGTDTNLKDSPSRTRYNAVTIRRKHTLPHGQMYEPRNDSFLIEGHCSAERTSARKYSGQETKRKLTPAHRELILLLRPDLGWCRVMMFNRPLV